jgi:hypothetical protein
LLRFVAIPISQSSEVNSSKDRLGPTPFVIEGALVIEYEFDMGLFVEKLWRGETDNVVEELEDSDILLIWLIFSAVDVG